MLLSPSAKIGVQTDKVNKMKDMKIDNTFLIIIFALSNIILQSVCLLKKTKF